MNNTAAMEKLHVQGRLFLWLYRCYATGFVYSAANLNFKVSILEANAFRAPHSDEGKLYIMQALIVYIHLYVGFKCVLHVTPRCIYSDSFLFSIIRILLI